MRFDNLKAQWDWNRRVRNRDGRRSDWLYGLVALLVSALWLPGLALGGTVLGSEPGAGYWSHLRDWFTLAPEMVPAGVLVAFLFRRHMREASLGTAAFTAPFVGLVASLIASTPIYYIWGPVVFLQFWSITIPLSWLSFWLMRKTDASMAAGERVGTE